MTTRLSRADPYPLQVTIRAFNLETMELGSHPSYMRPPRPAYRFATKNCTEGKCVTRYRDLALRPASQHSPPGAPKAAPASKTPKKDEITSGANSNPKPRIGGALSGVLTVYLGARFRARRRIFGGSWAPPKAQTPLAAHSIIYQNIKHPKAGGTLFARLQ